MSVFEEWCWGWGEVGWNRYLLFSWSNCSWYLTLFSYVTVLLETKYLQMEFQMSYFKSWKIMLWKVLQSICQQIWKPQDWKRSVFIPIPKKDNAKDCSNYHTVAFISQASKVMLKILQTRLQHYVNCELPDVQAGFRKGRGTRDQIANIRWIMEKAREFQKSI